MAVADGFHVDTNGNLWLGSDRETFDATTRSEAPFYVYANGDLVANSGNFRGDISGASGTFTGSITGASGTFTGDLSGSDITGGTIDIGSGTFTVDSAGAMVATSATITGAVTATSGSFTGSITADSGTIGSITIDSTGIEANYTANTSGFRINSDGTAEFSEVDIRLSGANGGTPTDLQGIKLGDGLIFYNNIANDLVLSAPQIAITDNSGTPGATSGTLIFTDGTYSNPGFYAEEDNAGQRAEFYFTNGTHDIFHTRSGLNTLYLDATYLSVYDGIGNNGEVLTRTSNGLEWTTTSGAHADSDHTSFATTTSLNNHTGNNSAHSYSPISINGLTMQHGYGITFVGGTNTSVSTTNTSPYEITISSSGGISSAVQGINGNTSSQHYFSTSGTGFFSNSDMDGSSSTHSFAFSSTMPSAGSITTGHHFPNGTKNLGGFGTYWDYVYYNNLSGSSDERRKNSIEDIDVGLDFINTLQPRKFKWNLEESLECDTCTCEGEVLNATCEMENCEGTIIDASAEKADDIQYGFIAQETLTLLDEDLDYQLVQYNTERDEYTMSYTSMIAPLVKAVQELSAKNDELELRIAALEA